MAYKTYVRLTESLGNKLEAYCIRAGLPKVHVIAVALSEYLMQREEVLQPFEKVSK